jgi:hypothetical protein
MKEILGDADFSRDAKEKRTHKQSVNAKKSRF